MIYTILLSRMEINTIKNIIHRTKTLHLNFFWFHLGISRNMHIPNMMYRSIKTRVLLMEYRKWEMHLWV